MTNEEYDQRVEEILSADRRFARAAYSFVADAVSHTTKALREKGGEGPRHISGQQLLEGIREYALAQFGPLALDVLTDWGVCRTEDFGAIVFAMVGKKLLGASEEDSPADFADSYDFREAFLRPFLAPEGPVPPLAPIDED